MSATEANTTCSNQNVFVSQSESTGSCAISATWWDPKGPTTAVVVAIVCEGWTITVLGKDAHTPIENNVDQ